MRIPLVDDVFHDFETSWLGVRGQDQTDREIAGRHERNGAHAREAELEAKRHISLIMDWLRPSPKKNLT